MEKKLSLGHLAALFTVVNWGTTFIATKLLLEAFTPIEILLFGSCWAFWPCGWCVPGG